MAGPQDARKLEVFGPKLYVETGNPENSDFGPEAAAIKSTNDDGCRFLVAHHESNYTRLETEGNLVFQAGQKGNGEDIGINLISHKGDIDINSKEKSVNVKASDTIVLEADKIVLKANDIQIGDSDINGTKEIRINGTRIQISGKDGNLPNHLKLGWGAKIAFGPGGFVGEAIVNKFFGR